MHMPRVGLKLPAEMEEEHDFVHTIEK